MIEITTLPNFEDMISLSDVAPILGVYALILFGYPALYLLSCNRFILSLW